MNVCNWIHNLKYKWYILYIFTTNYKWTIKNYLEKQQTRKENNNKGIYVEYFYYFCVTHTYYIEINTFTHSYFSIWEMLVVQATAVSLAGSVSSTDRKCGEYNHLPPAPSLLELRSLLADGEKLQKLLKKKVICKLIT